MQLIAVPAHLWDETHQATWLGAVSVASLLPAVVLTPYAGVLADRISRRLILMITQTVSMLVSFAMWGLLLAGRLDPWPIVLLSLVNGIATGFQTAAWQSFIPQLVPRSEMLSAVKLNSMQFTMARAIGPAAAGIIVKTFGAGASIFVNAITFLLVLVALAVVNPRTFGVPAIPIRVWDSLKEGAGFVWRRRPLRLAVILSFSTAVLGQSIQFLAAAVSSDAFGRRSTDSAGLLTSLGVGSVVASIYVIIVGEKHRRSRQVLVSLLLYTCGMLLIPLSRNYAIGLAGYFVVGMAHLSMALALNTLVQGAVPDRVRGRTMSFYVLGVVGGIPLGSYALGLLADFLGMRTALVINAAAFVATAGVLVASGWLGELDVDLVDDDLLDHSSSRLPITIDAPVSRQ